MWPQGIISQVYFMCGLVGAGFLIFNFFMGHMEGNHDAGHDGGHFGGDTGSSHLIHGGHHDVGGHHGIGGHHDAGGHGGHDAGSHHDGGHHDGHGEDTTNRYGPVGVEHQLMGRIGRLALSLLSPMSIAIFLTFFGFTGFLAGYLLPRIGLATILPAIVVGVIMNNIFKAAIKAMMKYGTSSAHVRTGELIGQVGEVLIPIAENRPGEVTYIVQSKILTSVARSSKPGEKIEKGTKVMIVETDGPTVFVERYKDPAGLPE